MPKQAFTRSGVNSSLDDIARQAGVGPGTLDRHFPTRDGLFEAVYHIAVAKLAAAERDPGNNKTEKGGGPGLSAPFRFGGR